MTEKQSLEQFEQKIPQPLFEVRDQENQMDYGFAADGKTSHYPA